MTWAHKILRFENLNRRYESIQGPCLIVFLFVATAGVARPKHWLELAKSTAFDGTRLLHLAFAWHQSAQALFTCPGLFLSLGNSAARRAELHNHVDGCNVAMLSHRLLPLFTWLKNQCSSMCGLGRQLSAGSPSDGVNLRSDPKTGIAGRYKSLLQHQCHLSEAPGGRLSAAWPMSDIPAETSRPSVTASRM